MQGLNYRAVNLSFAEYQSLGRGNDLGSVVADPLFLAKDPVESRDFRVAENSPAVARGFVPFDLRGMVGPSW